MTLVDTQPRDPSQTVFWHRDLPPLEAEAVGEHTVEATSGRVQGHITHGDELWGRCHDELMLHTHARLAQEIARLGGHYAHVLHELIDSHHDDATNEGWLRGVFDYVLYRKP